MYTVTKLFDSKNNLSFSIVFETLAVLFNMMYITLFNGNYRSILY